MMLGEIQNPTDKDLLRAIAGATANDTFDILYVRWQKRIFRFYLRRLRHAEKSRDLSQIFWRRFCQKCHLYNGGSAKSFLYVMAKNILRDDYDSKENQRAKLTDSMDEGQEEDNEDGPGIQRKGSSRAVQHQTAAHDLIKKEYLELVEAALSQLLPKYARVLRLKYLAGLSSEEIAVRLGTTVGAVDVALTRARRTAKENQTLRNLFSGGGGGY